MRTNTLLVMFVLAAGCVTRPAPHVTYYTGAISYSSPDGRLPYNKTEALLRREVVGRLVVDTRTESGNSPSMPPQQTITRHRLDARVSPIGDDKVPNTNIRIVRKTDGQRPMQVVEEYRPVSQAEYEYTLRAMRPPQGSE